nr:sensor histidine kinase [Alkalicoccus halolimnae]
MVIVLLVVGALTFNLVTEIIKDNAQTQIEQTALQSLGRIDSQYETIEMITSQIATNPSVQSLLIQEETGGEAGFAARQSMNEVINGYQAYVTGLTSFELYFTDDRRLFPLSELPLFARVPPEWIDSAQEADGRMIWAGEDPLDDGSFLTINQINLIEEDFRAGGYLVTKVHENYFNLSSVSDTLDIQLDQAVILDQNSRQVAGTLSESVDESLVFSDRESVEIDGEEHVRVETTSDHTGWTLVIFTPVNSLLQGITGIGTAILAAGLVGLIIFVAASWIVSSYISKPIRQLTHAMRFGTLGALKKSQRISSTTEITELNDTYNKMVETTNHLIKAVYEEELLKTRAELKALQAQINPHFLFNTLEAVYWTLEEKDEDMADMIISLSNLFRYTISDVDDEDWVTLCEELQQVERYMHIMKLRFGDRLYWEISMDEQLSFYTLPKLLIQPVIENALIHGIGESTKQGKITVTIKEADLTGYIEICVRDNGRGMEKETLQKVRSSMHTQAAVESKGTGLAMRNIYQRLELAYPNNSHSGLYIDSRPGEGTNVTFIIPKRGADADAKTSRLNSG